MSRLQVIEVQTLNEIFEIINSGKQVEILFAYQEENPQIEALKQHLSNFPRTYYYKIKDTNEAETLQIIKVPQLRIYAKGSESASYVGSSIYSQFKGLERED